MWRKPPSDTEKTHRWAWLTMHEIDGLTGGPFGPGAVFLPTAVVALPFRLVFVLLRLVVRTLGFLLRSASRAFSRRPMPKESDTNEQIKAQQARR